MVGVVGSWRCRSHFVGCRIFLLIFCVLAALVEKDRRLLPPPIDLALFFCYRLC